MSIVLENDHLIVKIKPKGAELTSVFNKKTELEYMWNADPAFWGKTSPVLFPIVGTLKDDTYIYKNKPHRLSRHGFARDMVFEVTDSAAGAAVFTLNSSPQLMENYPFMFRLDIKYTLEANYIHVNYLVTNSGEDDMYFSIGGHPAFKAPMVDNTHYEDYYLEFNEVENVPRWPISSGGLIEDSTKPLLNETNKIQLNKTLFNEDALVIKKLKSDVVSLKCSKHQHGLDFHFDGFPFLGIWAAKNADFVCIEPWCGIADSVTHNQQLVEKEGIEIVNAGKSWSRVWSVKFF